MDFRERLRELGERYGVTLRATSVEGCNDVYLGPNPERHIAFAFSRLETLTRTDRWLVDHVALLNPDGDALQRLERR